ncbi:MAG TPA: GGDEF domain-containing protein [Nakamurella sp.]
MTALHEFTAAPWRVRVWVVLAALLAVGLSLGLSTWPDPTLQQRDLLIALALVAGSVVNVELGRLFEGGRVAQQRPHKALSAWPMAATVLLPSFYLVPVVALIYADARWRGMRVTLWKWCASACFLVCAGAVAGAVVTPPGGDGIPPTLSSGLPGLLIMVAAVLAFLTVESAMLGMSAWLNTAQDDAWMRRTLADPAFYLTEAGVLTIGALTGLLGANAPWFVLLLIPVYGFVQQSVLHRPLQERATRDPKTGLLVFNAWQRLAVEEIRRMSAARRSWAVIFADIDNFRFYNQRHGHLGGDHALEHVAAIINSNVRPKDLIARFGGEEFCVLLPDTLAADAEQVAQRLRRAVSEESGTLPEPITVSIGVAVVEAGNTPMELAVVLARADQALYRAKLEGRNAVRIAGPAVDTERTVRETWEPRKDRTVHRPHWPTDAERPRRFG